ncbi:hypothetical protein HDU98_001824 [Podochytrium sp. JEL0797]|nr:hypothetical protein HDU98_001824 [Podochytrium sp. JEL0797]
MTIKDENMALEPTPSVDNLSLGDELLTDIDLDGLDVLMKLFDLRARRKAGVAELRTAIFNHVVATQPLEANEASVYEFAAGSSDSDEDVGLEHAKGGGGANLAEEPDEEDDQDDQEMRDDDVGSDGDVDHRGDARSDSDEGDTSAVISPRSGGTKHASKRQRQSRDEVPAEDTSVSGSEYHRAWAELHLKCSGQPMLNGQVHPKLAKFMINNLDKPAFLMAYKKLCGATASDAPTPSTTSASRGFEFPPKSDRDFGDWVLLYAIISWHPRSIPDQVTSDRHIAGCDKGVGTCTFFDRGMSLGNLGMMRAPSTSLQVSKLLVLRDPLARPLPSPGLSVDTAMKQGGSSFASPRAAAVWVEVFSPPAAAGWVEVPNPASIASFAAALKPFKAYIVAILEAQIKPLPENEARSKERLLENIKTIHAAAGRIEFPEAFHIQINWNELVAGMSVDSVQKLKLYDFCAMIADELQWVSKQGSVISRFSKAANEKLRLESKLSSKITQVVDPKGNKKGSFPSSGGGKKPYHEGGRDHNRRYDCPHHDYDHRGSDYRGSDYRPRDRSRDRSPDRYRDRSYDHRYDSSSRSRTNDDRSSRDGHRDYKDDKRSSGKKQDDPKSRASSK